jgi:hypothetical protein
LGRCRRPGRLALRRHTDDRDQGGDHADPDDLARALCVRAGDSGGARRRAAAAEPHHDAGRQRHPLEGVGSRCIRRWQRQAARLHELEGAGDHRGRERAGERHDQRAERAEDVFASAAHGRPAGVACECRHPAAARPARDRQRAGLAASQSAPRRGSRWGRVPWPSADVQRALPDARHRSATSSLPISPDTRLQPRLAAASTSPPRFICSSTRT